LKEKVKWSIVHLYVRKLRQSLKHRLNACIREEEHREAEYRESLEVGPTVHFCEPKKGVMLGKEYERRDEDLMENLESSV
jgi:hypothetical protein